VEQGDFFFAATKPGEHEPESKSTAEAVTEIITPTDSVNETVASTDRQP
jgi:hypothetical protein